MLRKEVFYLKLTLVCVHALMLYDAVHFVTPFDNIYGMLTVNALTFILLFIVHGYTYLMCKKLNMAKYSHLLAAISIMLQTNVWLHFIALGVLLVETYHVFKHKPTQSSTFVVSQK